MLEHGLIRRAAAHGREVGAVDLRTWVGRTQSHDGALPEQVAGMLGASLSHPSAPSYDHSAGAPMPPLWHWAAFPEFVPMAELGPDGHPARGGFLPPVPLPRRMWAGGRLSWEGALVIGEPLRRRSEILSVTEKTGAAGSMVFVQVEHRIEGALGEVRELQDIVYLAIPDPWRAPRAIPAPETTDFDETVSMSEARLFRFSAATFNSHRIHYDLAYAREAEKYPALVTHGPLQAMLLIDAACRHAGNPPRRFRFKGVHPMFHDHDLRLIGARRPGEDKLDLCTASPAGTQGLQAEMECMA